MKSRALLALIFFLAAPQKILWPHDFVLSLTSYHLLPDMSLNLVAIVLPWLELLVAILLICDVWTGPALLLTNAMLTAFLTSLISAYVRGIDVNCGCFGSSPTPGNMIWYLIRDTAFLALGLFSAWNFRQQCASQKNNRKSQA